MFPADIPLRQAFIAFEAHIDMKAGQDEYIELFRWLQSTRGDIHNVSGKKLAKSIMKEGQFRNDVLLMDAYASLEYASNKPQDARKVRY